MYPASRCRYSSPARLPACTHAHTSAAACSQYATASRSPAAAARAALAMAEACNNVIDFDTLNVASKYCTGARTCDFASTISWARRSAVASGSSASNACEDFFSATEPLRRPSQPRLASRVAGIEELPVQPLEHFPLDDLPLAETQVGDPAALPPARRLTALVRRGQVVAGACAAGFG